MTRHDLTSIYSIDTDASRSRTEERFFSGNRPTRRNSVKSIIAFVCSYKIKLRSVVFNPLLVRFFVFAVRLPVGFFFWFSASALSSSSPESFAFAFFPRFAAAGAAASES